MRLGSCCSLRPTAPQFICLLAEPTWIVIRMRLRGTHLYCGQKPELPEGLPAHVQAIPRFPFPSSFDLRGAARAVSVRLCTVTPRSGRGGS